MPYGPFPHGWPYSNFHDLNLDWILQKIRQYEVRLDEIVDEAVARANAYTDQQIAQFRNDFNDLVAQVEQEVADMLSTVDDAIDRLTKEQQDFIETATTQINAINERVDSLEESISASVDGMRAYTNQAILDNNQMLFDYIESAFIDVHVVNYFTGQEVTIQEMFDILAQFHLQNPLTYNQFAGKEVTYSALSALNVTYADLISNAGGLIN